MVRSSTPSIRISSSDIPQSKPLATSTTSSLASSPSESLHSLPAFAEEEVFLPTLSYKSLPPSSWNLGDSFVDFAASKHDETESVVFFSINPPSSGAQSEQLDSISNRLFVVQADSQAYMEVSHPVDKNNKESLTTILDLADENNCFAVVACVNKSLADHHEVIGSLLAVGFSLVVPDASNPLHLTHTMVGFEL
jgi:hypothetical protein